MCSIYFHYCFYVQTNCYNIIGKKRSAMGITQTVNVDRYKVRGKLGSGSFGSVFEGSVPDSNTTYAIKISKQKFKFESPKKQAEFMKSLNSEYVVKVYDYFIWNQYFCIVMEKCDFSLLHIYKDRHQKDKKRMTRQIIRALAFLHSKNLIHRDLKLQNILVKDGQIKLADFGLTKYLSIDQKTKTQKIGTYEYYAPEQLDKLEYNQKVDCWAVGLILLEIHLEKRVNQFRAGSKCPARYQHFPSPQDFETILDPTIRKALMWLLQRDPEKRATAQQIRQLFEEATVQADTYQDIAREIQQVHHDIKILKVTQRIYQASSAFPISSSDINRISQKIRKFHKLEQFNIQINHGLDNDSNKMFKPLIDALNSLERIFKVRITVNNWKENVITEENWSKELRMKVKILRGRYE